MARKALKHLSYLQIIHVSLDMDNIDPKEAPDVGTPVSGGLSYREAHMLMEVIADSQYLTSMDVVEIIPIIDWYNQQLK
ncbi:MAG: arginase family protein [Thermodesulfobacteriota bacterium]|nr:arginase family protein [Thermodesulfobacteriota bacterium]